MNNDENSRDDMELGDGMDPEAVSKFINGEISFNEYLNQIQDDSSDGESETVVHPPPQADKTVKMSPTFDEFNDFLSDSDFNLSGNESESNDEIDDEPKKRPKKKKRVQRTQLSRTMQGVMGQANVCYAQGNTEAAVKMCLEIIKEEPTASEPFRTLANIYEEIGQLEKSLQMRLIAAHLGPSTKEEWIDLANILKKKEDYRHSLACFTRAIRLDPMNISFYDERAQLLHLAKISAIEGYGYVSLLKKLNPQKHAEKLVYVRRKLASMYVNDNKVEKAYNYFKSIFDECSHLVTKDDIVMFLHLLVKLKKYEDSLRILKTFCGVETKIANDTEDYEIPANISIELRDKLIITLIHCNAGKVVQRLTKELSVEDVTGREEIFYNVASELVDKELYEEALLLLEPLKTAYSSNSTDLWFKLAHCYKQLNNIEECHDCYRKALTIFPADDELKLKLFNELKLARRYTEAIEITENSGTSLLIYEKCRLYELLNETDKFIEAGWKMFRLHCKQIETVEDFNLFVKILRLSKGTREKLSTVVPLTFDNDVSLENEWDIFVKICAIYAERKEYDLLQTLTLSLYLSFKFIPIRQELRAAMTIACILNHDYELGFDLTRHFIIRSPAYSERSWNTFGVATFRSECSRLHKFLYRYLLRRPNETHAIMLYANNCLAAGTYKYALNDYTLLYERNNTPILALLIGLTMLHITCQKYTTSKHALVAQMIAFLTKYQELRGEDANQEIFYNIGRAFHQLELLPQAIFYYKKALNCKPAIDDAFFDLRLDIAYNLYVIYLRSNQLDLASMYLQKYVVV